MSKFDEREKSFEKKFQMDEELQFKIAARSNKYLGEWASSLLGKNEEVQELLTKIVNHKILFESFPSSSKETIPTKKYKHKK